MFPTDATKTYLHQNALDSGFYEMLGRCMQKEGFGGRVRVKWMSCKPLFEAAFTLKTCDFGITSQRAEESGVRCSN